VVPVRKSCSARVHHTEKSSNTMWPFAGRSNFFRTYVLFDGHILEFAGLKDVATFLTFNEFGVVFTRNDAHARMPANFIHNCFERRSLFDR